MGTDSSVIAAIETAIALQPYFNIRVINLSLGRPILESYKVDPLCQAVEKAWQAGIVVVVAAGNDGRDLSLTRRLRNNRGSRQRSLRHHRGRNAHDGGFADRRRSGCEL